LTGSNGVALNIWGGGSWKSPSGRQIKRLSNVGSNTSCPGRHRGGGCGKGEKRIKNSAVGIPQPVTKKLLETAQGQTAKGISKKKKEGGENTGIETRVKWGNRGCHYPEHKEKKNPTQTG